MYQKKRLYLLASGLLGLGLALMSLEVGAQDGLTLERAVSLAYERNPEFSAARSEIGIASGLRRQAGVIPNPELGFEVEDTQSDRQTRSITITQSIELGGKRGARVGVADANRSMVDADLDLRRQGLRADVIQAFFAALRAQEGMRLAEASLSLAERAAKVADAQVDAGKVSPVEATRADMQLATVQLDLRRARQEWDNARQMLARLLGTDAPEFGSLLGSFEHLPDVPSESALLARVRESADMRRALRQVALSEAELGLQRSQRYPDISVSIGSQYDEIERERVNLVGLSVPLPLFDRNQGNVLAAARRAEQARDLRNAAELRVRAEIQQALRDWRTARADVEEIRNRILPAGQRTVEAATRGFSLGRFAFLDVLDAQRALIDARTRYLQSLQAVVDAWARIERLYGPTTTFE
ncbi:cytochrome c [Halopseudomonas aestusnigri]|uniref:TolC family protein n=1 Tax=Halopseudomonas TaxID=2901189 RepID=UPI0022B614F3|nr:MULTISPECIES: TolC family protein [Halopseudomonas]BDX18714.1 cytochrome c [Halopseudomonas aestusnigri]